MSASRPGRFVLLAGLCGFLAVLVGAGETLLGNCGPFVDVSDSNFCPFVLEVFYLGITTGTTATTYDPASNVTRLQMSAFLSRTVDRVLARGSRRAALQRFWTPQDPTVIATTTVGASPKTVRSDGIDLWVSNQVSGTVSRGPRVRWPASGHVDRRGPGLRIGAGLQPGLRDRPDEPRRALMIDPTLPPGGVTTVASNLGDGTVGVEFDGSRLWTTNLTGGNVSIITVGAIPWSVANVTAGFSAPSGIVFDGANIWTTDYAAGKLFKLDANGAILQTVTVGVNASFPAFDGTNIWVPIAGGTNSVVVVRASNGAILSTLTGNNLNGPAVAAFDGERVLVTNFSGGAASPSGSGRSVAAGLHPDGAGTQPGGACSDGGSFWVAMQGPGLLARF